MAGLIRTVTRIMNEMQVTLALVEISEHVHPVWKANGVETGMLAWIEEPTKGSYTLVVPGLDRFNITNKDSARINFLGYFRFPVQEVEMWRLRPKDFQKIDLTRFAGG